MLNYENVDKALIQGVELTTDWRINTVLNIHANYTYTNSKQKSGQFSGFPLDATAKHVANMRLDWETPVNSLDAWFGANYYGSEINSGTYVFGNGKRITINGHSGVKYPSRTTLDIGANYALTKNLEVKAAIYNLTDKTIDQETYNTVMEGRRLWLGLTASF